MDRSWPVDGHQLTAAREFLIRRSGRVVVASHNDVDGLASAVIVARALRERSSAVDIFPARRGEHVHKDSMRERIRSAQPDGLVVTDMGSRPGPIIPGLPTLVIDHHDPSSGQPSGALVVNGYGREPVATSSVLAYAICREGDGDDGSAWLAALGAVADLGSAAPFTHLLGIRTGGTAWSKAVSLLNAARRAPEDDARAALDVLERASGVEDIVAGRVPGVDVLERYRAAVRAEADRCSRIAPEMLGDAALIRFSSAAQVHPLVAVRWSGRLAPAVVIAANSGFLNGRVNFAVRSRSNVDLLHWLRDLPFEPSASAEYANGHPRATGGSLANDDFDRFVEMLRRRAEALRASVKNATHGDAQRPGDRQRRTGPRAGSRVQRKRSPQT